MTFQELTVLTATLKYDPTNLNIWVETRPYPACTSNASMINPWRGFHGFHTGPCPFLGHFDTSSYFIQGTAKKRYARRVRSPSRRICMGCQDNDRCDMVWLLDVAMQLMKLPTSTAEMEWFTGEEGSKHSKEVPMIFPATNLGWAFPGHHKWPWRLHHGIGKNSWQFVSAWCLLGRHRLDQFISHTVKFTL